VIEKLAQWIAERIGFPLRRKDASTSV
jgi:hypothetical protein